MFQWIVDKFVEDLQSRYVSIYIDDININIPTLQQHLMDLDAIFTILEAANLEFSILKTSMY